MNNNNKNEKPLNMSIPLSAMYKSLVKQYSRLCKYADSLESEVKELRRKNENIRVENKFLKEKIARRKIVDEYGGDVEQMHKIIADGKAKRKNMQRMMENFAKRHKGKDVTVEQLTEFFKSLETDDDTENQDNG